MSRVPIIDDLGAILKYLKPRSQGYEVASFLMIVQTLVHDPKRQLMLYTGRYPDYDRSKTVWIQVLNHIVPGVHYHETATAVSCN